MKRPDKEVAPASGAPPLQRGAPRRDPSLANLSLTDVRARRRALMAEENSVSYWRRIVQAKLDLVDSDTSEGLDLDSVAEVLVDAERAQTRVAHVSVTAPEDIPPVPDLMELWVLLESGLISDREARSRLREAEAQLSAFRREVHARLDKFTAELIARYHENPSLAVTALPLPAEPDLAAAAESTG